MDTTTHHDLHFEHACYPCYRLPKSVPTPHMAMATTRLLQMPSFFRRIKMTSALSV
jgi:hypothetical protein